jgi:hypothetical protein
MIELGIVAVLALLYFAGEKKKTVAKKKAKQIVNCGAVPLKPICGRSPRSIPAKTLVAPAPHSIGKCCCQRNVDSCSSPWFEQQAVWYITTSGTRRWVASEQLGAHLFGEGSQSKFWGSVNRSYTWAEIQAYPRGPDLGIPIPSGKVG